MEDRKDNLMECFMMLGFVSGNSLPDTDNCRNTMIEAVKNRNYGGLSNLMGITIDTCQRAVDSIRNVLAKQAEEQGITIEELIENLNDK